MGLRSRRGDGSLYFLQIGIVKLKKESEIERGALNGYCEIEKGKKIKTKKRTLDDLHVR